MNGESLNIREDNLKKLKELFPDVFSENKLDWEKLKATFSDLNNSFKTIFFLRPLLIV